MDEYLQQSGILDVRVDDRLIHGIVAGFWLPEKKASRVMVVNERYSTNDMMRSTLKMATPPGVALSVLAPEKAIANILAGNYVGQRVFIVAKEVDEIYALFKGGVAFARVNLGNITQNEGETTVLDKTVRVNSKQKEMLREMRDAGIAIDCQFLPSDSIIHCTKILD